MKGKRQLRALHKLGTGKTMEVLLGGTGCETLTPLPSPREPPKGTTLTSLANTTPLSRNIYTYIVAYSQRLGRVGVAGSKGSGMPELRGERPAE